MRLMVLAISNKLRLFFGILLALILFQSTLQAQITAPTSSYSSTTAYTIGGIQDEIFVFCDEANTGVGELKAVSPDGNSGWDFIWTKWDSGTNTFGGTFPTSNGQESILSNLSNGLYRVSVEKVGEVSQVYKAWVINHSTVVNKPILNFDKKNCAGVDFKSTYTPVEYKYNNYPNSDELVVNQPSPNPLTFVLKRGVKEVDRISDSNYTGGDVDLVDKGAYESTVTYSVTVIDGCGFEFDSDPTNDISTYVVDARFDFTPITGEAPLEVNFNVQNFNDRANHQWYLYQDKNRIDGPVDIRDSLLVDVRTGKDELYTYLHPGKYLVKLIATNNDDSMNCVDVFTSNEITVEGSIFEVPNVFTPNGDGANDEFRLRLYSVKSYSVKIFNRWGRLVYEFQESDVSAGMADRKSSKGWDGKINGKLASPGTYFYVVEAEGREEEGIHYTEKGSLTLLHDK